MFILLVFKELEITISYILSYDQWPWVLFKHPSINRRSFSRVSSSAAPCNEAGPVNSDGHHSCEVHLLTYPSLKWNDSKRRAKDYQLFGKSLVPGDVVTQIQLEGSESTTIVYSKHLMTSIDRIFSDLFRQDTTHTLLQSNDSFPSPPSRVEASQQYFSNNNLQQNKYEKEENHRNTFTCSSISHFCRRSTSYVQKNTIAWQCPIHHFILTTSLENGIPLSIVGEFWKKWIRQRTKQQGITKNLYMLYIYINYIYAKINILCQ